MIDPALMTAAGAKADKAIADLREAGKYASDAGRVAKRASYRVIRRFADREWPEGLWADVNTSTKAAEEAEGAFENTQDAAQIVRIAASTGLRMGNPNYARHHIELAQGVVHYARRRGHDALEAAETAEQWLERN
jgi:hypothetical protein